MSNKNLKVYQIQFVTELRKLNFNVKFPCQVKVIWKRSNEVAQSSLVPLHNGVVNFNQTLKLSVNMYFDTTTNKFVEKKCQYTFQISTQKGEKSAGSVYLDLSEFFNKRIYELDQTFTLEKCPVAGTNVEMKITYEQDTKQKGYDSMRYFSLQRSCISATNPLDSSTMSLDLGELSAGRSDISQKNSENQTEKSSKSAQSRSESGNIPKKQEQFDKLDASDVIEYPIRNMSTNFTSDGSKIGENIKNLNSLTTKINDFVNNKSKNIKFEIQGLRRRITQLQEQSQGELLAREKSQKLYEQQRKKSSNLSRQYQDFKTEAQHKLQAESRKSADLESKLAQNKKMITQMESNMNKSGESQSTYIQQLKSNALATEQKHLSEIEQLRKILTQEKKLRNEANSKIQQLEGAHKDLKIKYTGEVERSNNMQQNLRKKQGQIEETRIHLEKAFQNLVSSLSSII